MNIEKVIEILQKPEVMHRCNIENIESIEFSQGFEEDNITIQFDEKLDFDYSNYDLDNMLIIEKIRMESDYKRAKKKQRHQAICVQHSFKVGE